MRPGRSSVRPKKKNVSVLCVTELSCRKKAEAGHSFKVGTSGTLKFAPSGSGSVGKAQEWVGKVESYGVPF